MIFSDADRAVFEDDLKKIMVRLEKIQSAPEQYGLIPDKNPHIWKRYKELSEMTDEELMNEIEADCAVFRYIFSTITKKQWDSIEERCEITHYVLRTIHSDPSLISLVPGEDAYIWAHLNKHVAMSPEELKLMFEAEDSLLLDFRGGC